MTKMLKGCTSQIPSLEEDEMSLLQFSPSVGSASDSVSDDPTEEDEDEEEDEDDCGTTPLLSTGTHVNSDTPSWSI